MAPDEMQDPGDFFARFHGRTSRIHRGRSRTEYRPATVTGRLRHPPDEETEPSGGVWLIEGLRLGRASVFAPLEQARDPRPSIGGR